MKSVIFSFRASVIFFLIFFLFSFFSYSQVTSSIDSTSIKIGEQITYHIQVKTDSTDLVVFPEGQTFMPLEMIESYTIDTLKSNDKFNLIKKYGLTQFDSGTYTIPRQKIIVGNNTFFTDSLQVEVRNVLVDSTKQGLYDIKPIINVEKTGSNWWKYVLLMFLIIGVLGFLIYWFIWRKKPLTKEEQIALLPPYDRAKLALKKLDERNYLENEALKDYYSELTFIIRNYLDEKVYERALESTTDELIDRLNLLKAGNKVDLSQEDIKNLEVILKRADLVKFAKSNPDVELAKMDRNTIDIEIDHVKEALPEPTEEEKLQNIKYRQEQDRKKKRNKIILTIIISIAFLIMIFIGFSIKYGFNYVKDTITGHDSIALLEGDWITSEYGVPPIMMTTPKVLKRLNPELPNEVLEQADVTMFGYGSLLERFSIVVATSHFKNLGKNKIDLQQSVESHLKIWEQKGIQNMVVQNEKFTTPNGAEGLKTYGNADFPSLKAGHFEKGNYAIFSFTSENVLQQIILSWRTNDTYASQIVDRIQNSIELKKLED